MVPAIDETWALATREIRLLARSRGRITAALAVPLAGGVVCGWMTRTTSLPPAYCLVIFMLLGAVVLSADRGDLRSAEALSAMAGRVMMTAAWILAALPILIAQIAVIVACAAFIGGFQVSFGILAATVAMSLLTAAGVRRGLETPAQ